MQRTLRHSLFTWLSDLRLAAGILAVLAVATAVGTWIESHYANLGSIETGQAAVFDLVYDAPWFNALLGLLFTNLLTNLIRRCMRGRQPLGYLLVHVGILVMLAGAGLTRWFGYEGLMRIREGAASTTAESKDAFAVVARGEDEAVLSVRLYRPGAQSHSGRVGLGGDILTLGVTEYWPRFARRLEPGAGGIAGVELAVGGALAPDVHTLYQGDESRIGQVAVRFHAGTLPTGNDGAGDALDLARRDGAVVMRATFDLAVGSQPFGGDVRAVPAGAVVKVEIGQWIRGGDGYEIVVNDVAASLVERGGPSTDPDAPAAARISLEIEGERVEAICVQGDEGKTVELAGRAYRLRYGPVLSDLPYEIFLEDFVLQTYPGSDNPASYESHVLLSDPARGISGRPVRIWMNHPLHHRGTKHFQSSYDHDRRGTVLSINRDPGMIPTYVGYTVITLGFLVLLVQIVIRRVVALRVLTGAAALAATWALVAPADAEAQEPRSGPVLGGDGGSPPELVLSRANLAWASRLIVQDYRGRMKPFDTLARETAMKITRRTRFEDREPVALFLGFALHPEAWYEHPVVFVSNPGVQKLLGVDSSTRHVPLSSLLQESGYQLREVVGEAHRTSSYRRDKTQQKLILFDERVHLLFGALQGSSLRIFPVPDDPGNTWQTIEKVLAALPPADPRAGEFKAAAGTLFEGLLAGDDARISEGLRRVHDLQQRYGGTVLPAPLQIDAELSLNRRRPFLLSTVPYLLGFVLLIATFFVGLLSRHRGIWSWRRPLYLLGMLAFLAGLGLHLWGFVLRWIASGRGPLSNGHESLLWVALTVALAGVLFEVISRTGAVGALSSLLTSVTLGVSMLGTFDPSIGPLRPVLASYWLNIHVTVITAGYGFLGLACLLGLLTMVLFLIGRRGPSPDAVRAVGLLDALNVDVMIAGLGLLTVGTLLGGVWANESWGRYWGWDPKETWALVSILLYAMILHFRWIPGLANPFAQAAGSFLAIWSIIMTYFGVNYLLMGMHSYAAGDKVTIPAWVTVSGLLSVSFCCVVYRAWSGQRGSWRPDPGVYGNPGAQAVELVSMRAGGAIGATGGRPDAPQSS